MWDGTLGFYIKRLQGAHWQPFFEQANEHRIILSKILFWIDYRFFGGLSYFLISANITLMFALWATLWFAARLLLDCRLAYLYSALAGVLCFSWLQYENINWGFQSGFYLAYLLPMLGLILLGCWVREARESRFVAAVVLGVLSAGTMANGLLTLPLLIVMLLVSGRATRIRVGILLLVTMLTFTMWLYHYQIQYRPGASLEQMAEFVLMFLGGPIGFIFHQDYLTIAAGIAAFGACVYVAARWIGGERDPIFLGLFLFCVYIGAAATAAAIGRSYFGISTALAGRYETPILLLYSTVLLLFIYLYRNEASTIPVIGTISVFVPLLLLSPQLLAFSAAGPAIAHQRMQGALALDMGVGDVEEISKLYPTDQVRITANEAIRYNLSIFATPLMREAREAIGETPATLGLRACRSYIDKTSAIKTDDRYVSVRGWAFDERTRSVPPVVFLVTNGVVTGAAVTGAERPDVQQIISRKAVRAGFDGYMLRSGKIGSSVYCPGEKI